MAKIDFKGGVKVDSTLGKPKPPKINFKGGIKVDPMLGKKIKVYVHPFELDDIEFLMQVIANARHKGSELLKVIKLTNALQKEYNLLVKHMTEKQS
jgi:hypothetical protein